MEPLISSNNTKFKGFRVKSDSLSPLFNPTDTNCRVTSSVLFFFVVRFHGIWAVKVGHPVIIECCGFRKKRGTAARPLFDVSTPRPRKKERWRTRHPLSDVRSNFPL